ncbi:VENN motif pre-toxin domain-containing protein [Suttonella indologenes]|uniref:VENN motif pre-toxin domain-containing protein n=1 Tax=Suttonella indologenes TaxID=13276 RepID=UPI000E1BC32A|nr:VENN motif pre-toxin domain-containing protein [Suttonella indologenes]
MRQLINTKVEAAEQSGDKQQAAQLQKLGVALDMLASGLSTPNGNGLIGSIANTGAPLLTYQLGQIAKTKQAEGSTAHIGAHAALAALTAALGDNDPLAAALSAGGSEAAIPLIAQSLYGTQDPAKLSSAEKSQLADIAQLIGAGIGGIAGGGNTAVATAADAGRRAVEGNYLNVPEAQRRNALLEKYAWLDSRAQRAWYQSVGTEEEKAAIYEYLQIENLDRSRNVEFNKAYDNCRINADCEKFHYLHVTQRTLWNAPGIELFKEDMRNNNIDSNWEKYPDSKNAFHNFSEDGKSVARNADGTFVNTKYIHRNGQYEVIVDRNNNIVTLPSSAGTFNYYPESEGIGHIDYDVDPWMDFGSGNGDNTTYDSRKSNSEWYYRNFLGEFSFGPNVDAIKTFNSTDEKQGRDK